MGRSRIAAIRASRLGHSPLNDRIGIVRTTWPWPPTGRRLRGCIRSPIAGTRFQPPVFQHAVWLYLRFTLSYRDVEELLAQRGLDLSYESVRSWVLKFGPMIARRLRQCRPRSSDGTSTRWWSGSPVSGCISGARSTTSRACDKTIAPRIHTRWCDGASARCSGSNQPRQPSVS